MITPSLADELGCNSPREKYLLSTCGTSTVTKYGRRVQGVTIQSMKGDTFKLPTLIECDNIPGDKKEIPTPDLLRKFPHLQEIASEIPLVDPEAEIHLLIGRDAPEILKVRAFKNGPKGAPWAHKLLVGWTVSGQICIDRFGGPIHLRTCRTVCSNKDEGSSTRTVSHKPNLNDVVPCANHFLVKELPSCKEIEDDVFRTGTDDNEKAMSIEDRRFPGFHEQIYLQEYTGKLGNSTPFPFREPYFSQQPSASCTTPQQIDAKL